MKKGLKANALSFFDTVCLTIAGTAPSYSLNASTAALIAAVGMAAPGALIYGAIPMLGIAFAFKHLNSWRPDAGAVYAWVGRSVNPYLGFICAWTFIVLSTAFIVTAIVPIGVTTLQLVNPGLMDSVFWSTAVGAGWFALVAFLTILGIHAASKFQKLMTAIEVIALTAITIGAIIKFGSHPVNPFSWDWFLPTGFPDFSTFMAGMLIAIFYYFGWDVSSNVAEETHGEHTTPGVGGLFGVFGVIAMMLIVTVAIELGLTVDQVNENAAAVLPALGNAVLPAPWGNIAILAVLLSTLGTIETQTIQMTRTLFSMGRDRVLHEKFGEIHHKFETPWLAGTVVAVISFIAIWISSYSESINSLMLTLISAISVMVAFYYGMTGIACAWYYRRTLHLDWRHTLTRGAWPIGSAIFLLIVAAFQFPELGLETSLITVGAIAVGLIPMIIYRIKYRSDYYFTPLEQHANE